jgi:hypothetical protein
MGKKRALLIRPSVINPALWGAPRPKGSPWARIRKQVLERDNFTCQGCGHRALKFMNVHHLWENRSHALEDLTTLCVACHAILHLGRAMSFGSVEVWNTNVSQIEIIQRTRAGVKKGKSLAAIKKGFKLKPGPYTASSLEYANSLVAKIGRAPRAYLEEPLSAVFVRFRQWQLKGGT